MITRITAESRGLTSLPWLKSRHSFSFGDYYDPSRMGHGALRVINDDIIAPAGGFDMHPHRDMEILTYILEGELEHRDSMGHGSILRAGDLQRMTAGRGIRHSEFNASPTSPLHLLQIWITPAERGLPPAYEERRSADLVGSAPLTLLASASPSGNALKIHQSMEVSLLSLSAGEKFTLEMQTAGLGWIQIFAGRLSCGDETLAAGDALKIEGHPDRILITVPEMGESTRALVFRS